MNNYLDYKATVWFRIPIESKESADKIIKKLETGYLPSELYNDKNICEQLGSCEILYDTETYLSPQENKSHKTIEIFTEDSDFADTYWDNINLKKN